MSYEEEEVFLASYEEKAKAGVILDISEIKTAYQEKVGHSISSGQINRVLARHIWRKVMPRSRHPKKTSDEVIATSKNKSAGFAGRNPQAQGRRWKSATDVPG